jgi:hypothetical protein
MEVSNKSSINGNSYGSMAFVLYKSYENKSNLTYGDNSHTVYLSGDINNKYPIKQKLEDIFSEISLKTNNTFISWNDNNNLTIINNNAESENLTFQIRIWNMSATIK